MTETRSAGSGLSPAAWTSWAVWTPPQWSIAFPATVVVMLVCVAGIVAGRHLSSVWLTGVAGGIVAGLCLSIAWTLRRLLRPLFALLLLTVVLALTAAWLAMPDALAPAVAIMMIASAAWVLGYHDPLEVVRVAGVDLARRVAGSGRDAVPAGSAARAAEHRR